jgi:methyl-accepting chemotaxis protein
VANEVKELAKETATATKDIDRKIMAIQGDARSSVAAIDEITTITRQINEIQNKLACAVEQQTVTTHEIGRSMFEVAKGSADIAQNITGVARAARDTSGGIANTQQLADTLAKMAVDLQELVRHQFKVETHHTAKAA